MPPMPPGMNMMLGCMDSPMGGMGGPPPPAPMMMSMAPPPPPGGIPAPPPPVKRFRCSAVSPPLPKSVLFDAVSSPPPSSSMYSARNTSAMVDLLSDCFDDLSEDAYIGSSIQPQATDDLFGSITSLSSQPLVPAPSPLKQSDPSFIVGLQQANGSWLLNDQLAGAMSKSVQELRKCCPVSCDVATVANIWATLIVIEFLKKKYSSMMEELELVIMKAEQWLGKQVLPAGAKLAVLKDSATKVF